MFFISIFFFPSQDSALFSLDMNDARPMNLILTSSGNSYATFNLNKDVNLYVSFALLFHRFLVVPGASYSEPLRCAYFPACVRQLFETCFY